MPDRLVASFPRSEHPLGLKIRDKEKSSLKVKSIEEKPTKPKSNFAIPGLYLFDNSVVEKSFSLKPSARGELEITDLIKLYLKEEKLGVEIINRGIAWLDTGTYETMNEASNFIQAIENFQGLKIGCPEEVSWRLGLISNDQLTKLSKNYLGSEYGDYLIRLIENQN